MTVPDPETPSAVVGPFCPISSATSSSSSSLRRGLDSGSNKLRSSSALDEQKNALSADETSIISNNSIKWQHTSTSKTTILISEYSTPNSDLSTDLTAGARQKAVHSLNPLRRWCKIPPIPEGPQASPETTAGFLSRLTFTWIGDFMHLGYLRELHLNDIPLVPPFRSARSLTDRLQSSFNRQVAKGEKHPLLWALNEAFFLEFWLSGLGRLIGDVLLVMSPFMLRYLIQFSSEAYTAQHEHEGKAPPLGRSIGLAVGITLFQVVASVAMGQNVYLGMISGGQMKAALIGVIFRKSLRLSARARAGNVNKEGGKGADTLTPPEGWTNGHVTNLMSTDASRIDFACAGFHLIWTSPIVIILTLILLLINLSYSALSGFALLVLSVPVLGIVMQILTTRRHLMSKITDKRVNLMQEILLGVRFVKYYAWEQPFLSQLKQLRTEEIRATQFLLAVRSGVVAVGMCLPVFGAILAFITYSLVGHNLNPAEVFSSLALFNALRLPLNLLPVMISRATDAWVSVQRIEAYLKAEEVQENRKLKDLGESAVRIVDGEFTWEKNGEAAGGKEGIDTQPLRGEHKKAQKEEKKVNQLVAKQDSSRKTFPTREDNPEPFQLKNINLSFGSNELVAIVGSVGSGKTSLLAALAGEMRQTVGEIRQSARLAYCPQSAWIQNASVRDNVVFGRDFDADWYQKVVYACALQPDLDMFPDGDQTEIGERGITVSGGQKQRINIARAIYFDTDIVLMDDPLSAVDAHVGKHLFDEAICGLMKDKCRILATHQLHVLSLCDRVVWMDDGLIKAVGTYDELMKTQEGFRSLVGEYGQDKLEDVQGGEIKEVDKKHFTDTGGDAGSEKSDMRLIARVESSKRTTIKPLMQTEERATSSVGWKVYKAYIEDSGTILTAPGLMFVLLLSQGANLMTTLWLSYWTSDKFGLKNHTYAGIFGALGIAQSASMFLFAFWLTVAGTTSSKRLSERAMERVLRAPMSFFDTTPIGRIINRFSKDVDVMDNILTDSLRMYLLTLAMVISTCILITVFFPYFAIALFPLAILFFFTASYYRSSAREVKRHEAVLRSFVYAKFGEAVTGIATIRAYRLQEQFVNDLYGALDRMNSAYFITFVNQRWLSLRLDTIGNMLLFTTTILVIASRTSVSPAISGVVLSYICQTATIIQWMIQQMAEVENAMNSTERVHYYGTELPSEAPLRTNASVQLRPTWPELGRIQFENVELRYRPGLPLVLKGVNLDIQGGERIGVVGRTGAGKSSVMSALFRLIELSKGHILIDGVNIHDLGLFDLRTKLAIIPQDPTLFRGTVRSNLDPFGEYTDEALWVALRKSYLVEDTTAEEPIVSTAGNTLGKPAAAVASTLQQRITLDTAVVDAGENFSLGQRQLMALARALVRNSRIVVCDEATSSVDQETDRKIQRTMQEGFKGRTILCIAHRLWTVLGYDRVVVMDQGVVAEIGTPKELWNRGGAWRGMCEKAGVKEEDFLFREGD